MAFSAEEILEEFVEASYRADTISPEACMFRRYLLRKQSILESVKRWRQKPGNYAKVLSYMKEYFNRPERKAHVKEYQRANIVKIRANVRAWRKLKRRTDESWRLKVNAQRRESRRRCKELTRGQSPLTLGQRS